MLTIIQTPISKLKEDRRNARMHDRKNLEAIKGSLKRFGQQKPIVVDKDNNIIAGNGTYAAAKELGWDSIDVVQTELDGDNIKAYALADNRSAELAIWNDAILGDILQELRENSFPIADIGFDPGDFFDDKGNDGLTDPDDVPEVPQNVRGVQRGQIWQLGDHRLMCGDSTSKDDVERLMNGEKADMVFTDPPYGVGYEYNSHDDNVTKEEHAKFSEWLVGSSLKMTDRFVITPGCYNLELYCQISKPAHIGCWTKTNAMSPGRVTHFWTWEPVFFYGKFKRKRGNDVFNFPVGKQPDTGDHTCPKPISLWLDIVDNFSEPGELIFDYFLGSGSTLIACEKTNRKCYGMEIDPHYCSVIIERWEKFSGKKAIIPNSPEKEG